MEQSDSDPPPEPDEVSVGIFGFPSFKNFYMLVEKP
jgi:hypothetical protein